MKHLGKKLIFILVTTLLSLYIAIPSSIPVNIHLGPINFEQNLQKSFLNKNLLLGLDLVGGSRITFEADTSKVSESDKENALDSLKKVMEKRVNLFGISESSVVRSSFNGKDRIIVELPGVTDTQKAIDTVGKTAQLVFTTVKDDQTLEPSNLTGSDLKTASVTYDQISGKPVVTLEFTDEGAKKFEDLTSKSIGKPLPIVLDNEVISAPVVNEKIIGGRAQISGNFTQDEARVLSIQLNAGALPLPVTIVDQKVVGASLGSESVSKTLTAGIVGIIVVLLFMLVVYRKLGLIAGVGIFIFACTTIALYKVIPVVLTLPGVAGFLLSVGMALDSNILIFERFREEKQKGSSLHNAMEVAFGRAWNSIRDANVATLITAFVLANPLDWQFLNVSGPIRGFAFTLALGIVVGLYTGIFVTRTLIRFFIKK